MATTIPIKVYEILEDRFGKETARELVHEIEISVDAIATQKKVEIRDELSKELLTKAEFQSEIKALRIELESKMRLYFLILLFAIIILNPRAIDLIAKLLGIIK